MKNIISFIYGSNKRQILFAIILWGTVFLTVIAAGKRYFRLKATGGPIALSFSSSVDPLKSGENFNLTIKANPNDLPFNAFELHFSFDNTKVELQNPADLAKNFEKLFTSDLGLTYKVVGNKIVVSGAKTGEPFSGKRNIGLVKVKMKVKDKMSGEVKFVWDDATEIEGLPLSKKNASFTIKGPVGAKLYFDSKKTNYAKGENFNLKLFLDTAGRAVNAVQFEFNYDDQVITFQNPTSDLAANNIELSPTSGFDINNALNTIDTQKKMIRIGLVTTSSVSGNRELATVKLKIKDATEVKKAEFFANDNSKVYNLQTQNILSEKPIYSITIGKSVPTVSPTSHPTRVPTPTGDLTPTPPPKETVIPIGKKSSLTIKIGSASAESRIRFAVRLAHVQNNPEMYMRLRVKDELAFKDIILGQPDTPEKRPSPTPPTPTKEDTCNDTGFDEVDFWVPMRADEGGIYKPVPSISPTPPAGKTPASVSTDGWVALAGVKPGRYYTFLVKAPKSRGTKMLEHFQLEKGSSALQDFDWSSNPLAPGDLPNPNDEMRQDCTVNSVDISLIFARHAACCNTSCDRVYDPTCPDWDKMVVADVNYDGVIDGNDISKVVDTLSSKPDDD